MWLEEKERKREATAGLRKGRTMAYGRLEWKGKRTQNVTNGDNGIRPQGSPCRKRFAMPKYEAQGLRGKGIGFRTGTCSIRISFFSHPPQPSKREIMNRVLQALILSTSLHKIDLTAKPVSIILLDCNMLPHLQ